MSENLKAAQLLHTVVLAVCGTIAAFLIDVGDGSNPYAAANAEIVHLQALESARERYKEQVAGELNEHDYPQLRQAMNPEAATPSEWRRYALRRGSSSPMPAGHGITPAPAPTNEPPAPPTDGNGDANGPPPPAPAPAPDDDGVHLTPHGHRVRFGKVAAVCRRSWGTSLAIRVEAPPLSNDLEQIYQFFTGKLRKLPDGRAASTEVFVPFADEFAIEFREFLEKHPDTEVVSWRVEPRRDREELFWLSPEESRVDSSTLHISYTLPGLPGPLRYESLGSVDGVWECASCYRALSSPFMDWLESSGLLSGLSITRNGTRVWLPAIRAVWSDVRQRPLEEVQTWLNRQEKDSRTRISFLGVSINAPDAALAVPILFAVIVLMIRAHVVEARGLVKLRSSLLDENEVSWSALFLDPVSRVLAWSSLVLLPLVVEIWLVVRSKNVVTELYRWDFVITFILTCILGWLVTNTWSEIAALKNEVHPKGSNATNNPLPTPQAPGTIAKPGIAPLGPAGKP